MIPREGNIATVLYTCLRSG
uniref:Uncharacterized protein n=1 Tax=Timema poppense TaxID=170557 RepID=A0A7R9HGL1_TIMPO|nr:unnamed protein product [Timema poppensis]